MNRDNLAKVRETSKYYNVSKSGLVSAEEYRNQMILEEQEKAVKKKQAEMSGIMVDDEGNKITAPIELDSFLQARKAMKRTEFKELQDKMGFYFSDALDEQVLYQQRANEGMFLLGTNLSALLDLFRQSIFEKDGPMYAADGKTPLPRLPKSDILGSGRSYELIGEYVDMDKEYDKLMRDIVGLRMGPEKALKPEDALTPTSQFDNIIEESSKYTGSSSKFISPNALFNMVRILDKYKTEETQWLRVATVLEIIYSYMSNSESRDVFFKSTKPLDRNAILELDEFFRTDHLFMSLNELLSLKNTLEFYRAVPGTDVGIDRLVKPERVPSAVRASGLSQDLKTKKRGLAVNAVKQSATGDNKAKKPKV
jgi:hypothetical protein